MNNSTILKLINNNNLVWSQLYYDELISKSNYELSYFKQADELYYNCVQAIRSLNNSDLKQIEQFYHSRNVSPCFYLDPSNESWLSVFLMKHNYIEIPGAAEHWWIVELSKKYISSLKQQNYIKPRLNVSCNATINAKQLDEFIEIDKQTNKLSAKVTKSLAFNLHNKRHPQIKLFHLLGKVDLEPAFCGSIGLFRQESAHFAEDGTLTPFRQNGLHSYITQRRLIMAFEAGVKYACTTCHASSITNITSSKVGMKFGFKRRLFMGSRCN